MEGRQLMPERPPSSAWGRRTSQALMSQMDKVQQTTTPVHNVQSRTRPNITLNLPSWSAAPYQRPDLDPRGTESRSTRETTRLDTKALQDFVQSGMAMTPTSPSSTQGAVISKKQKSVYRVMPYAPRTGRVRSASYPTPRTTSFAGGISSPKSVAGSISSPTIISTPSSMSRSNDKPLPQPVLADEVPFRYRAGVEYQPQPDWPLQQQNQGSSSLLTPPPSAPPTTPLPPLPTPPIVTYLGQNTRRDYPQPHWKPHAKIAPASQHDYFSPARREANHIKSASSTPKHTPSWRPGTKRKSQSVSYSISNSPYATPAQQEYQYQARPTTAGLTPQTYVQRNGNGSGTSDGYGQAQGQVHRPRVSRADSMPLPLFLYGSMQDGKMDFHVNIADEGTVVARELPPVPTSATRESQIEKALPPSPPPKSASFQAAKPLPLNINKSKAASTVAVHPVSYADYQEIKKAYNGVFTTKNPSLNKDKGVSVSVSAVALGNIANKKPSTSNAGNSLGKTNSWILRLGTWFLYPGKSEGQGAGAATGARKDRCLLCGILLLVLLSFLVGLLVGVMVGSRSR